MTPFPRGSYNAESTRPARSRTERKTGIRPFTRRLVSFAVFSLALPAAHSFAGAPVRTVAQDGRGATFEISPLAARFDTVSADGAPYVRVSMPGSYAADEPGRPALPTMMIPVGVPDGMSARARVISADWEERAGLPPPLPMMKQRFVADDPKTGPVSEERYDPDPAIYGRGEVWPKDAVSLGEGGPLGDSWMMPAIVRAVRYDPGHKRLLVLKRMTLRVEFVQATARELKARPAVRPGADVGVWQRLQRRMLGNYESARAFPRRASLPAQPTRLRSLAPRRGALNPEFRLSITTTGWSSVSYATMAAAGFPAGVAISEVGVWERGYDDVGDSATSVPIPVVARDSNTNGVFDSGDQITFYARNLRDRVGPLSIENRYSYANVYWLTWTGTAAAIPDSISGLIPGSPPVPTSFLDTIHMEQNLYMMPWPSTTVGTPEENVEYFFWTDGAEPDQFDTTIPFLDPDPSNPFRIQARYQGRANITHQLDIYFQSSSGTTDTLARAHQFFGEEVYLLDTGFTIPGSHIGAGTNRYDHVGMARFSGSPSFTPGSRSPLDWVDVTYSRRYLARGDRLEFTSGSTSGIVELHVGGFTRPGIEVYDITAPAAPLRVTGTASIAVGPLYEVVFRADASAGVRRFVAFVTGSELPIGAGAVERDAPSSLTIPSPFPAGGFARAILIAPDAFLAPANRLAAFRRGQGYAVEIAAVQDLYDEFNGGVKSAAAIRRYLLHAYSTWTPRPSFAALLGDASMDYRHDLAASNVDWVPTYMAFETIQGPSGSELVANDSYYAFNLGGGSTPAAQVTPSLFLGRVPAGSAAELDQYVTKIIQYENFQPTDTWRGRQLLLSDDEYSSTIFFSTGYCLQPSEATFHAASQSMADVAAASPSGADISSVLFDLSYFTDKLATICMDPANPGCRSSTCVTFQFRRIGNAVDSLQTELAKGQLVFNVQAHANRKLIAHEHVFDIDQGDMSRISNLGRPFFYMVWGCHANQFADAPSGTADIDPVGSFGEQFVMLPDRGAIGGLGSTAYELIDTNANMNSYVADALYTTPPAPPPPPGQPRQARWIMGEIVGQAYVRNANSGLFLQQAMNRTVTLLGDPMMRMDALPPRVFEVTVDGVPFPDNGPFTSDSPTATAALVAKVRDEAGLRKTELAERSIATGTITPLDSTLYSVAISDTGRANTLTASIRPRVANYDLLVRSTDTNGREQTYGLQVRSTVRYLANGVVIVNGTFVESNAVIRAEVTTPIPVTADSLTLLIDGVPLPNVTETAMDGTGRRWALVSLPEDRGPGVHTLDVEVNGRTGVFPQATFNVETGLALRRVVVVSPRLMGSGCDGSVFQFELSTPVPKVELLLMTVSGRRVASAQWPGKAGFNVYCWDGRDSQGNTAATGLYFYRLTAVDAAGHKATQSGRMIRTR